jgi:hypothetical protein
MADKVTLFNEGTRLYPPLLCDVQVEKCPSTLFAPIPIQIEHNRTILTANYNTWR